MKASITALGCLFLCAACTAPQGRKLSAVNGSLPPVATGPLTSSSTLTTGQNGERITVPRNGKITVNLDAAREEGYAWRLAETPDPSVLKVVSQTYTPPPSGVGRGTETWVFQATGLGDVDVKMWYGDINLTPLSRTPNYQFTAEVSEKAKSGKSKKHKLPTA